MSLAVAGRVLELEAAAKALAPLFSETWLGTELWPAARALVAFLEGHRCSSLSNASLVLECATGIDPHAAHMRLSVLQGCALRVGSSILCACGRLGAGTGACGLAAATLGARRVLLTDKIALLPTLQANVAAVCPQQPNPECGVLHCSSIIRVSVWQNHLTSGYHVRCEELTWAEDGLPSSRLPFGADIVLAADCLNPIYGGEHAGALAATIRDALHRSRMHHKQHGSCCAGPQPEALLAQTRRGHRVAESVFFAACAQPPHQLPPPHSNHDQLPPPHSNHDQLKPHPLKPYPALTTQLEPQPAQATTSSSHTQLSPPTQATTT